MDQGVVRQVDIIVPDEPPAEYRGVGGKTGQTQEDGGQRGEGFNTFRQGCGHGSLPVGRGQASQAVADANGQGKFCQVLFDDLHRGFHFAGDEPFEFLCVVPNTPDTIELVDC